MKSASIVSFISGDVEGVVVYPLNKFDDDRGWLCELFRQDRLDAEFHPAMAYVSFTKPSVTRGPHEHVDQADLFCFLGPSDFHLRMWDNRPDSATFRYVMDVRAGENEPKAIVVPKGVVHAYRNYGAVDGMVVNCPNRLYMGKNRSEPVDEIRHEDDPDTEYLMD
jgi:dTDP-4-dehydrorhamnose 3,5-epimerase